MERFYGYWKDGEDMVTGEQESDERGLFRQQLAPAIPDHVLDKASPCNSYIMLVSLVNNGGDAAGKHAALRVVYALYQQEAVFRFAA